MLQLESTAPRISALQAARVRWKANTSRHHTHHALTFDELFRLFENNCNTTTIARKVGISSERVRQLYGKYFQKLLGGKSISNRRRSQIIAQQKTRTRRSAEEFLGSAGMRTILKKARSAGWKVKIIPCARSGIFSGAVLTRVVKINGRRCSLHHLTKAFKTSPKARRDYARTTISERTIGSVDTLVVRSTIEGFPEHTFIIPAAHVRRLLVSTEKKEVSLYFPIEHLPVYKNSRPRLDMWEYEDAWHFLSGK